MQSSEIHDRLVEILPAFRDYWDSPENYFREDDSSFTECGVFAECSHYVTDYFDSFTVRQIEALGRFISQCMETEPESTLADAAATCFLENLARESFFDTLTEHLSGGALSYYRRLHAA